MKYEILLIVVLALVIIGFVYLVGGNGNETETETNNSTTVKNCAYITSTTTLEDIRNCFRD